MSAEASRLRSLRVRPAVWSAQAVGVRIAVLIAVAWFVLLLATFGSVLATIDWNADVASTLTIGEFFPHVPHGATVTLASYPWYATLWFELLTRHFPFHREIWEVAPWLGSLAAIGLLSWTTAKVAGRWAAGILALLLVCAGKNLLFLQFAPSEHGTVVWYACLLNAFLILLVAREGKLGRWSTHVLASVLIGAVVAIGVASDKLLYLAGLVPFLVAGLVVSRLAPRVLALRILLTTVGITGGAIVGSRVVVAAMRSRHVVAGSYPIAFTSMRRLVRNALDSLQSLFALFNGTFDGSAITARSMLAIACATLVVIALIAATRFSFRWSSELGGLLLSGAQRGGEDSLLRTAHLSFWLVGAFLPLAAFELTTVAGQNDSRYLLSTGYGLAVLIIVAIVGTSRTRRTLVTFGACVIAVASVVSLARDFDPSPGNELVREVLPFVEGEGLTYGYAAYWVAVPLTWRSHLRVQVAPVVSCPKAPHHLCAYYNHTISSWYQGRPGVHSFLIVDHRYGPPPPARTLGGTIEVVDFPELSIYVYDYDIGSNVAVNWQRYIPSDVAPPLH